MRIVLQPAFLLHSRPYRETSLLMDIFSHDYGRASLVARNVRKPNSVWRALLQPFTPLLLSFQGRGELMTLTTAESNGIPFALRGDCLLTGFYLNELLTRVLHKADPYPELYTLYYDTLLELQGDQLQEKTLRLFEKKLLIQLGYALQLTEEKKTGKPIIPEADYQFYPEQGFVLIQEGERVPPLMRFSGKSLLALAAEVFDDEIVLKEIKRLMRLVLAPLIGSKPLHCRELFI